MARQEQLRRGTTAQHESFTGAEGEVTMNTTSKTLVVHDGETAGGFPLFVTGMIIMWSGASTAAPAGWYFCDGDNGTPDLRAKFIKGVTSGVTGATGGGTSSSAGAHTHTGGDHNLTEAELPVHSHNSLHTFTNGSGRPTGFTAVNNSIGPNNVSGGTPDDTFGISTTSETGEGNAHNHGDTSSSGAHTHTIEPVYYELCYIMKG